MPNLADILRAEKRPAVIADCVKLVDEEVSAKKGLSGVAIKGAYGAVKAIKPGIVTEMVDSLLDDWVARLEPHFQAWQAGAGGNLADFLSGRADQGGEDLLAVTDERAQRTKHKTAKKIYDKLRPSAKRNVSAGVPRLGALVERHLRG
jgi:hypothetical protein